MGIGIAVGFILFALSIFLFIRGTETVAFVLAFLGILTLLGSFSFGQAYYNARTVECTIVDKDRANNSNGESEYRVYTEQCGTFVNQDSLFRGKYDSGDMQGQLQIGETYELEVAGARVPFLSMFPNIYNVRPVA